MSNRVVVLGSGPGGYSAAFRAADLGLEVTLIERYSTLGGVCLNVGCIPSKALLHIAAVLDETEHMANHGVDFGKPKVDIDKMRDYKNSVIDKLTGGLSAMAKQRKVNVVQGVGEFASPNSILVKGEEGEQTIEFDYAIIAAGSQAVRLPFLPEDDPRVFTSTGALELQKTDGRLLIIGGGIIGLEMGTVYAALGAKVTVVEFLDQLIAAADADIVKPLAKRLEERFEHIWLETKVTNVTAKKDGLHVEFEGKNAPEKAEKFDQILVAVGRSPNGKVIGAENAGVKVDERGFIAVDNQMRTNVNHIFAIGDIASSGPMLAHKAVPEGRLAAEVIAGKKHFSDQKCIASVAYTDPEVAWVGLTEKEAKAQGIAYEKGAFPWAASGRALANGRSEGMTKLLFNENNQVVGGGIVGTNAGELVAEIALAIEMGCDAEDVALTTHPHPSLSESIMLATEAYEGTITDLYMPKKRKK